jgi:hypothetical protein
MFLVRIQFTNFAVDLIIQTGGPRVEDPWFVLTTQQLKCTWSLWIFTVTKQYVVPSYLNGKTYLWTFEVTCAMNRKPLTTT